MERNGGETVLYAGTSLEAAREVATALESVAEGIETAAVDSIDAALDRLSGDGVDCLVCEPVLSDGAYRELLERAREVASSVPFVLVADDGSESLAVAAFRAGVTDYVPETEEGTVEALAERLERALDSDVVPAGGGRTAASEMTTAALSALLAHLPAGVLVENASREVLTTNETFTTLLDIDADPGELVGRDCDEAAVAVADRFEHPDEFVTAIRRTLAERNPVRGDSLELTDGRILERDYVPYESPHGEANLWLYRNVTERAERERLLREREEALERENERLDAFASTLSHDVRGPLNVAQGRLELAREEGDSDHLTAVDGALDRIDALVDDVLSLAREEGRIDSVASVSLSACARGAWAHVETGGATVEIDTDETVFADRSRLERLFENLFRNSVEHGSTGSRPQAGDSVEHGSTDSRPQADDAIEHGSTDSQSQAGDSVEHGSTSNHPEAGDAAEQEGPSVTVRVGALDDGFYVEDDGVGIPPEEREVVFDEGHSSSEGGTGFGLAIVRRIADAHGWTVTATEGSEGGARFEIRGVTGGSAA